jgi:hypothetical protein
MNTVQRVKPEVLGLTEQVTIRFIIKLLKINHSMPNIPGKHKLVLIGGSSPVEISKGGIVISRRDLETKHEEADNIIAKQVMICD